MTMHRREFLIFGAAAAASATLAPGLATAQERFIKEAGPWRRFEIVTRLDIVKPQGKVQAWVPMPSLSDDEWSKPLGSDWTTNAKAAKRIRDPKSGLELVHLQWIEGESAPFAEISGGAITRDRATDFSRPLKPTPLTDDERKAYVRPPAPGLAGKAVGRTIGKIIGNAKTDLGKAKAIYEWLADTRECRAGGKGKMPLINLPPDHYADVNVLYVALAHAAGVPARIIYGLRVAESQYGYASLGVAAGDVTRAQHCRAEVWLEDYGWTPVDVSDVCWVMKSEPPATAPDPNAKVTSARLTLFGAWEGNWLAYNMADTVTLPGYDLGGTTGTAGSAETPPVPGRTVAYLMYPQAETAGGLLDCRDPEHFKYTITAKELPA